MLQFEELKGGSHCERKAAITRLQSKGLNASVYKDLWSRLIDLVIMCVFGDQQLKAGRQTQPAGPGLGYVYAPEALGKMDQQE